MPPELRRVSLRFMVMKQKQKDKSSRVLWLLLWVAAWQSLLSAFVVFVDFEIER